jgi:hypothetical protein
MTETIWKEWVLDISCLPVVAFCPVDGEAVVFGMSVIADRCPGLLSGVVSQHGTKHVEAFIAENPGWQWSYGSTADLTGDMAALEVGANPTSQEGYDG